jgi:quercetin dioxygenase-like cupin family protein
MKPIALIAALALAACATASAQEGAVATPLTSAMTTNSGQPIALPQGPVQVTVSRVVIPAGTTLPVHKHPYPRYAYVEAGRIRVTNIDTGGEVEFAPGGFIVEAIGQWHTGLALGPEAVSLLVIDQHPPGEATTIRRDP